jgi:Vacuolar import and degradation protein
VAETTSTQPGASESSLRNLLIAQNIRRHPRLTQRSRSELQDLLAERQRTQREGGRTNVYPATTSNVNMPPRATEEATPPDPFSIPSTDIRARVDAYRQRYLQNPHLGPANASGGPGGAPAGMPLSRQVEDMIQYLERLRSCDSLEEASACFIELTDHLTPSKSAALKHRIDDIVLDLGSIEPPNETSWLTIGSVFEGSQCATHGSGSVLYSSLAPDRNVGQRGAAAVSGVSATAPTPVPRSSDLEAALNQVNQTYPDGPGSRFLRNIARDPSANLQTGTTTTTPAAGSRGGKREDTWPVKVSITSVDYRSMTLTGTMEAFNVPDQLSPTLKSSITTYLEGEIIDFRTWSLETKSFCSNVRIDATYWRKLEPFKDLTDDQLVKNLCDRNWLAGLRERFVLMRWKGSSSIFKNPFTQCDYFERNHGLTSEIEKCFISPCSSDPHTAPPRSGLTISGFYYVCLRREDGHVEGFYFDPNSSPYQQLRLTPRGIGSGGTGIGGVMGGMGGKMFPTYSFR